MKIPFLNRKGGARGYRMVAVMALALLLLGGGLAFGASGGDHGEGHGEAKGWVATDTYRVMNFTVLAVALFFIIRKPASQALNGRIQGIKEQLEDLEAKKTAAEKTLAEYDTKLAALEKEAEGLVADYIKQGEAAKAKILAEAAESADKLREQAKRNIEHEFKRAKEQLRDEVVEAALVKAEDVIRQQISDDDQNRLVDEYLEKVVA
ncbi:MAG: ATP synthase F0 subunit B [Desulfosarcinaceae bacterium]|nr:ATP synthase F0 subunit B [Desulfosarcinaceae bacterium]